MMSQFDKDMSRCDGGNPSNKSSASEAASEQTNYLDHEIAQLTKLGSSPHVHLGRVVPGRLKLPISTVKMLLGREGNYGGRGRFSSADRCHLQCRYLPVNGPRMVDQMRSRAYVSQFSADGSLFIAGFQGSRIKVYDVDGGWKVKKDIRARNLRWTITDTSLSPDRCYLVYASMSPIINIVNVGSGTTESVANVTEIHCGLRFSADDDNEFGIFSIKYSTDGRELVAGTRDSSICVYDLGADKLSLRIPAHLSDVNTVCFADETGHLIYSGSDDRLCKVWDRRCFTTKGQAAGILMGHLEGITFIDSRGDGRYLISNGKDQTTKLWDIRKMSSNALYNAELGEEDWDYRWMEYPPQAKKLKHPKDQSLASYEGHSVLRTLIRCYFSPSYSTGQKYIYSGSSDGFVYVYDLVSGAQVARLEHHEGPVRDCSWHPFYPMLISSSWDGDILSWEFPGGGEACARPKRRSGRRRDYYYY